MHHVTCCLLQYEYWVILSLVIYWIHTTIHYNLNVVRCEASLGLQSEDDCNWQQCIQTITNLQNYLQYRTFWLCFIKKNKNGNINLLFEIKTEWAQLVSFLTLKAFQEAWDIKSLYFQWSNMTPVKISDKEISRSMQSNSVEPDITSPTLGQNSVGWWARRVYHHYSRQNFRAETWESLPKSGSLLNYILPKIYLLGTTSDKIILIRITLPGCRKGRVVYCGRKNLSIDLQFINLWFPSLARTSVSSSLG